MISYVSLFFSTPSWWMPDSWAKALAPTTALFGWTSIPVKLETNRKSCKSGACQYLQQLLLTHGRPKYGLKYWRRTCRAITSSSSEAFPARSPMPLMVHSNCRAPFFTASRKLATAKPKSLWPCTEIIALSTLGTFSLIPELSPNSVGVSNQLYRGY